jgi:hypothetical protein
MTQGEVVEAVPDHDGSVGLSMESARRLHESRMPDAGCRRWCASS